MRLGEASVTGVTDRRAASGESGVTVNRPWSLRTMVLAEAMADVAAPDRMAQITRPAPSRRAVRPDDREKGGECITGAIWCMGLSLGSWKKRRHPTLTRARTGPIPDENMMLREGGYGEAGADTARCH
ncbi:hypothetical protein GLI01_09950 [Gluconacetobacter liquefaciens]|nr:hypothetical protein GLI01_09950 [Gluconacetobacter liquefaciens]